MRRNGFIIALFLLVLFLVPAAQTIQPQATPEPGLTLKSDTTQSLSAGQGLNYLNVTALWRSLWDNVSSHNLQDYCIKLSQSYPNRIWLPASGPSKNLTEAVDWVNGTLFNQTSGTLWFTRITEYGSLLAVKNGTSPAPRPAIVFAAVLDSLISPGANDVGGSVAAILETARLLDRIEMSCDIYYFISLVGRSSSEGDLGARAFVEWLNERYIETVTVITYDRILYDRAGLLYGTNIGLRTYESSKYTLSTWVSDVMITASQELGTGRARHFSDHEVVGSSCAAEFWQTGRAALHVSQGYWYDPTSATDEDVWDADYYSYEKARETVACAVCAVAYIGRLGSGSPPAFYESGILAPGGSSVIMIANTRVGYLNATIVWNTTSSVKGTIEMVSTGQTVYLRTENDSRIVMKYLAGNAGRHRVSLSNLGPSVIEYSFNATMINDCDSDTLSDIRETELGTSVYSRDTDRDGLTDDFELQLGTNPLSSDSDGDGANDYQEYVRGSNRLVKDTDQDGIEDGPEFQLGTDPTKPDTDDDGISDYDEVYVHHTNPLDKDTDSDGLEDGFEIQVGFNPISRDTDGDGLTDLFEVLNDIDPLSRDTDGDGWSDSYEVEHRMLPNNPDTDGDGIPDGVDWNPREHWISVISPVVLISIVALLGVFSFLKYKVYMRTS